MYEKFNEYISSEFSHDYWQDEGIDQTIDILYKFNERDWERLNSEIQAKDTPWKIKLANCLGDVDIPYSKNILLFFIGEDSEELLEASVDSLRNMDLSKMSSSEKEKVLIKINSIIPDCDKVSKGILLDFKERLQ